MATWNKLFSFFTWKNRPDTSTPLGQTLLNRLNTALNGIDDRVVTLNTQKVSTDEIQGVFTDVRLIKNTGQFVFTLFDGTEKIIDTALEKISINVSFDQATQMMVLEKDDGSKEYVDLSVFTTQYEFVSSPTIQQTVTDGKVRADIKPNSITDQMLQTNYLADVTTQANTAVSASQSALESQSLAEQSAEDADRHADRAEAAADRAEAITGFTVDMNLDKNSSNPIANKAVAEALGNVDAKTLGGHGAEYFVEKAQETLTNSILEKALTLTNGMHNFILGGANYTGNDLPSVVYAYGNATVESRGREATVILWGRLNSPIAVNYYVGEWSGWQTFATIADLANYLPKTGGKLNSGTNNPLELENLTSDTVRIRFSGASGDLGYIGVTGKGEFVVISPEDWVTRDILHTGNKPTGSYNGNGSATSRTVNVGGVGGALLISNSVKGIAIVTSDGAFGVGADGNPVHIPSGECKFVSGVLTTATTNALVNADSYGYKYISI